jgi:hypothetical protein
MAGSTILRVWIDPPLAIGFHYRLSLHIGLSWLARPVPISAIPSNIMGAIILLQIPMFHAGKGECPERAVDPSF